MQDRSSTNEPVPVPILYTTDALPPAGEAEQLLAWAHGRNPGAWADHSRVAARAAKTIADRCGLETHRAYISGLLHDIGRYEGVRQMHHIIAGHRLLKSKNYGSRLAGICLSHSFPCRDIREYFGENDCSPDETEEIIAFLAQTTYDDYDRLIQLCDALATADGVCLIDVRVMDVIRRYGFNELTPRKIEANYANKAHFDKLCGMNIYDLFYDEIRNISFR